MKGKPIPLYARIIVFLLFFVIINGALSPYRKILQQTKEVDMITTKDIQKQTEKIEKQIHEIDAKINIIDNQN